MRIVQVLKTFGAGNRLQNYISGRRMEPGHLVFKYYKPAGVKNIFQAAQTCTFTFSKTVQKQIKHAFIKQYFSLIINPGIGSQLTKSFDPVLMIAVV